MACPSDSPQTCVCSEGVYCDNIRNFKICRNKFEFNSIPYSFYTRFIELLHPGTIRFFKNTCKQNYVHCLDLKGIAVDQLNCQQDPVCNGFIRPAAGVVELDLQNVRDEWTKYLVVGGFIHIDADYICQKPVNKKLDFVKKHKDLNLTGNIPPEIGPFIHKDLEIFVIYCASFTFEQFTNCLDWLNVCTNFKTLHVTVALQEIATNFHVWRRVLEQFHEKHKHSIEFLQFSVQDRLKFKIQKNEHCYGSEFNMSLENYLSLS